MDIANGLFEFAGALLLCLNVRRLAHDKRLAGVHWGPTMFFTTWGVWNLFYYPSLDQRWSFYGACCLVSVNFIWLAQVWYFSARAERAHDVEYAAWCLAAERTRLENIRRNEALLRQRTRANG